MTLNMFRYSVVMFSIPKFVRTKTAMETNETTNTRRQENKVYILKSTIICIRICSLFRFSSITTTTTNSQYNHIHNIRISVALPFPSIRCYSFYFHVFRKRNSLIRLSLIEKKEEKKNKTKLGVGVGEYNIEKPVSTER